MDLLISNHKSLFPNSHEIVNEVESSLFFIFISTPYSISFYFSISLYFLQT